MSLDSSTGVLSGTPTKAGKATFTVTATNGVSPDASTGPITITVTKGKVR
ncbi:putative Ig domain-containing protein [Arthrobacter nitrophenolicus]